MLPNKKNILVVDDDDFLKEIISEQLITMGMNALTASNASEAIRSVMSHHFDFILSDIRMPKGDGITLLKEICSLPTARPVVILMSGFSDYSKEELIEMGAFAVLDKPFPMEALLKILEG